MPVLSSTIVRMARLASSASAERISTPSSAPRPVPTMIAVGVASPRAQGQAMISTATAAVNACSAPCPVSSQPASVSSDSAMTTGTKMPLMRSTRCWTGAFDVWACSTRRAMCASCVSAPTRVARTSRRPCALTVAPATSSPAETSSGTDSPVSIERSTALDPVTTTPSVAIFSPGRTTNTSPVRSSPTGIVRSRVRPSGPSSSTVASLAPRSRSARSAAEERWTARAWAQRPKRISVVTTAADSR